MIASVAGAWTRPRPPPRNNIATTMMEYGVSTAAVVAAIANPPAIDTSPPVTTALVPMRSASLAASGAVDAVNTANGTVRTPASSGAIAAHELEVLRDDEHEAEEGEEGERHRHAAGGEAQVGEHRDVEHRVVDAALPPHEPGEQGAASPKATMLVVDSPAVHRALDDGPHEHGDAGDRGQRSDGIEAGDRGVARRRHDLAMATNATAMTGTLIISTEPHQKCSSSQPPVTGPRATATPAVAAQMAMAIARSLGAGKTLTRMASVAGNISAAPTPIAARQAMSSPALSENAANRRTRRTAPARSA